MKLKVIIISYGHPCSGLTLAKHLSSKVDLTFLLVASGDKFERGVLSLNLKNISCGLITARDTIQRLLPGPVQSYIGESFNFILLKTQSLKIMRDWNRANLRCCLQAVKYIWANDFDVVHFNGTSGFQIYFHPFLLRKPKVYTIHDYIPHSGEEKCRTIFLNKIFSRLHYQYILHSKLLKERFTQYYKVPSERVHSIYNGPLDIYKVFIASRENEDNNTVLFWGRIAKYKGLRCLLEAANIIKQEVPEIKIVICGKGTLDFKISDLDRGIFEINNAYLPNDTLVDYIKRSAIIVLPYTDATQSAVLMTAYAFNKPVVASRVGGIPEVIEDGITGILVPPGDAQELARAVVYLLNNPIRRRQMSENIRNKMVGGEFDWDFIVERITEVYKKAIREN